MKRIIQIVAFILFAIALIGLMGFIYLERENQILNEISVRVCRDGDKGFLVKKELYEIIERTDSVRAKTIKQIDVNTLEKIIGKNPYIENVDIFVNINNNLIVNVKEKNAILRIFNQTGEGYYIDENAEILPLSNKFSPRVLIANGYINTSYVKGFGNIYDSVYYSPITKNSIIIDLFELTKIIRQNNFLQALISQIYVNSKGEFDLIPQLGKQIIHLGSIENIEKKLNKLEIFYKKSMMKAGWEKYETINLKYKDQVVCTKK